MKFHENPSSGSRVVPYVQMDGRTVKHGMLTDTFRTFENALKYLHFTHRGLFILWVLFNDASRLRFSTIP
jgi:hypothetical protein